MTEIDLLTSTGHKVVTVAIPIFKERPDAITWGSRFFTQRANGEYREAFTVCAVVTIHDEKPRV